MSNKNLTYWLFKGPAAFAHYTGQELKAIAPKDSRYKKQERIFLKQADSYLWLLLGYFDNEAALRIVKTWLQTYQLSLDPYELTSFKEWNNRVRQYIDDMMKSPFKSELYPVYKNEI